MFIESSKNNLHNPTESLKNRRKIPRCVMLNESDFHEPLKGISAIWSDRSLTAVLDMSWTGLVLENTGYVKTLLSKAKSGDLFEVLLKLDSQDEKILLPVRVLNQSEARVECLVDGISSADRIQLDQAIKDKLVQDNLTLLPPTHLDLQFHNSYWFHGPFDTNIVVTSESSGLIEYDGLLFKWDSRGAQCFKSVSSSPERAVYSKSWMQPPPHKVSAGASWKDRVIKLFTPIKTRPGLEEQSLLILSKALKQLHGL